MRTSILANSTKRLIKTPEHQTRLKELRAFIALRYEAEMRSAGFLRRLLLKQKIELEFRRERSKIEPSDRSV